MIQAEKILGSHHKLHCKSCVKFSWWFPCPLSWNNKTTWQINGCCGVLFELNQPLWCKNLKKIQFLKNSSIFSIFFKILGHKSSYICRGADIYSGVRSSSLTLPLCFLMQMQKLAPKLSLYSSLELWRGKPW